MTWVVNTLLQSLLIFSSSWDHSSISVYWYTFPKWSCWKKHRHLLNTDRSLLLSSFVPDSFWGEGILTAAYLPNRTPTPALSSACPYERLYGQVLNYSILHVFGFTCFVLLPEKDCTKLSARCVLCVFLGYGINQKSYRCYDPVRQKLYVLRHVTFLERHPYFSLPPKIAPVAKEDLVYIDLFPSEVPSKEYISTVHVSDLPVVSSTPSRPHLILPLPYAYSRPCSLSGSTSQLYWPSCCLIGPWSIWTSIPSSWTSPTSKTWLY